MHVVVRGLMAAGMGIYAAMHLQQALSPPPGAPTWLTVAFATAALVALVLAILLIAASERTQGRWEWAAALLAGASALALVASYTVGFFGVVESDLRPETAVVAVAEVITLVAFAIGRIAVAPEPEGAPVRTRAGTS